MWHIVASHETLGGQQESQTNQILQNGIIRKTVTTSPHHNTTRSNTILQYQVIMCGRTHSTTSKLAGPCWTFLSHPPPGSNRMQPQGTIILANSYKQVFDFA